MALVQDYRCAYNGYKGYLDEYGIESHLINLPQYDTPSFNKDAVILVCGFKICSPYGRNEQLGATGISMQFAPLVDYVDEHGWGDAEEYLLKRLVMSEVNEDAFPWDYIKTILDGTSDLLNKCEFRKYVWKDIYSQQHEAFELACTLKVTAKYSPIHDLSFKCLSKYMEKWNWDSERTLKHVREWMVKCMVHDLGYDTIDLMSREVSRQRKAAERRAEKKRNRASLKPGRSRKATNS